MIAEHQRPIVSGFNAKSESSDVLNGVNLQNKVIIVTGGYSGIGIETTRGLALAGAEVIIPAKRVDVAANNLNGIVSKGENEVPSKNHLLLYSKNVEKLEL